MVARNRPAGIAEHRSPTLLKVTWNPPPQKRVSPEYKYLVPYIQTQRKTQDMSLRVRDGKGQFIARDRPYRGVNHNVTAHKNIKGEKVLFAYYYAIITKDCKTTSVPCKTALDAAKKYDEMAKCFFGDKAILNFPDEV